jgi:hypothetical protein
MALEVLAINSDNLIRLDGLTNASSGAYINNATVTYALLDNTGATVTSGSLSSVAASNGRYEGTVIYTTRLTLDTHGHLAILRNRRAKAFLGRRPRDPMSGSVRRWPGLTSCKLLLVNCGFYWSRWGVAVQNKRNSWNGEREAGRVSHGASR